jgi:hypothetical protein
MEIDMKKDKGDVYWYRPDGKKKRPIAYSTSACSYLVGILSLEHETVSDVYNAIHYDLEAKEIVKKYIDLGYGDCLARELFRY